MIFHSLGLMSGTSMDGIDAALIHTDGEAIITSLTQYSISYSFEVSILLKSAEYAVRQAQGDLEKANTFFLTAIKYYLCKELQYSTEQYPHIIKQITHYLQTQFHITALHFTSVIKLSTQLHAQVVHQLLAQQNLQPADIDCIGYHGQTLFHQPKIKKTIQAGDGALLAKLTQIPVIHDFRQNDVFLGGQGAPFAPLYHQALARRDKLIPLAVINFGGIANISLILGETLDQVIGFDTGPANCLIDAFVRYKTQGQLRMDKDGLLAQKGKIQATILEELLEKAITIPDYFNLPSPKSLDIQDIQMPPSMHALSIEDGCATLTAFTVECIVRNLQSAQRIPKLFIIAGGGAYNLSLLKQLQNRLQSVFDPSIQIKTADEIGWDTQALEAQLMAYFAVRSLKKLPLSTPHTTGVPYPATGGVLKLPADYK